MGYNEAFLSGLQHGYKLVVYGEGELLSASHGRGSVFSYGYEKYNENEERPIYFDFESFHSFNYETLIEKYKNINSEFYYSFCPAIKRESLNHLLCDLKLDKLFGRNFEHAHMAHTGVVLVKVFESEGD